MKKSFFHTELLIYTKRYYPVQELFELMKENLGERLGKIYTNKEMKLLETIFIEGEDGFVNITSSKWLSAKRGQITVGMQKPLKRVFQDVKDAKVTAKAIFITICILTIGIAYVISRIIDIFRGIFNLEGTKENRAMMKAIALEVEKIVSS